MPVCDAILNPLVEKGVNPVFCIMANSMHSAIWCLKPKNNNNYYIILDSKLTIFVKFWQTETICETLFVPNLFSYNEG